MDGRHSAVRLSLQPGQQKVGADRSPPALILEIWDLAAAGRGPSWIAHHLNETKRSAVLDPRIWTYKYSRTLERSRTGGYLFGKKKRTLELTPEEAIIVENAHLGFITRALFDQVQDQMAQRKRYSHKGRKAPNARYPLTGLLVCGHCGGPMIHHGRNRALGYQYYTCANKLRKGKAVCDQENVRSEALHDLILLLIEERLITSRLNGNFWRRYKSAARSPAGHLRRLDEIDQETEQSANNVSPLLIKTSNLSDTLRDRVTKQTEQAIERLQEEKTQLKSELDQISAGGSRGSR